MSRLNPTDTAGEEQRATAEQEAWLRKREREIEDFKWLAGHVQGRRFLWRLLGMSGQFDSSMTGNSETFAREGARRIGLAVVDEFHKHSLDAYTKMVKENQT